MQTIMHERAAKSPFGGRSSVDVVQRHAVLLIDLAFCANCGARLWYLSNPQPSYRCSGHASGSHCNAHRCVADLTEERVLQAIGRLSLPSAWRETALDHARQLIEVDHPDQGDRVALEAKLKRLARLYQDGMIDDTAYERDRDAIRAKLTIASTSLPLTDLRPVASLLGNLPELLKEATTEERRAWNSSDATRLAVDARSIRAIFTKCRMVGRVGIRPQLQAHFPRSRHSRRCFRKQGWEASMDHQHLDWLHPYARALANSRIFLAFLIEVDMFSRHLPGALARAHQQTRLD
jgi:hypothetical protein